MVDLVDRVTRSRMMSGIRAKDTKPECVVRRYLHRAGLRFRLHGQLPGRPDLVFPRYRTVVFVHGCFWHRHRECKYATNPGSNSDFWAAKFSANVERDIRVTRELEKIGWKVLVIWSCQLENEALADLAENIRRQ